MNTTQPDHVKSYTATLNLALTVWQIAGGAGRSARPKGSAVIITERYDVADHTTYTATVLIEGVEYGRMVRPNQFTPCPKEETSK